MYKWMFTLAFWPMRCARSSACTRMPGVQCSSAKTTVEAAVRVMPTPAACRLRNCLCFFVGLLLFVLRASFIGLLACICLFGLQA